MSRLIDNDLVRRKDAIDAMAESYEDTDAEWILQKLPTVDAVPVAWINKHLEWLDNCDNDFAQLAKVSIRGMLELWRKDGMLNDH